MKAFFLSLLLCLATIGKSQYNTPFAPVPFDTTKFDLNYVPDILTMVYSSFEQSSFGQLIIFTDDKIDFINGSDTLNLTGECVTPDDAIMKLQSMFGDLKYCCFFMGHRTISSGDDLIRVRVVIFPDRPNYGVTVYFLIKEKRYISTIAYE